MLKILVGLSLLFFSTYADDGEVAVVSLTKDTFDKFIEENQFTVVEFFAPWCGHCKNLAPEYEAAAKELRQYGIKIANVDATVETELGERYKIDSYPTLKVFRNGNVEEYGGGRTKDTIVQWVRRMVGPSIVEVGNMEAAKEASKDGTVSFVAKIKSRDTPAYQIFSAAADKNRQAGKFIVIFGNDADDTIIAIREEEGITHSVHISDEESVKKFMDAERFPLFGSINAGNYADYFNNNRDLIWFAGTAQDYKKAAAVVREAAVAIREKANYVWLNIEEFRAHAESALGVTEFPSIIVQKGDARYLYEDHNIDSAEKLVQFVNNVYDGKIEKYLISEPIPETNDEPVKVVVGKSLDEMVVQQDKDVFFEVYAPWCAHCKQFEPVYTDFAKAVAKYDHVVVAKMDGTKNESPNPKFSWTGFPTVFFIKAGSDTPKLYDGARTVQGLMDFLREHSSKPLQEDDANKDEL